MSKTATLIMTEKYVAESRVPIAILARLMNVSPSLLRGALRGDLYIGSERESRLLELASLVAQYTKALRPLPLPPEWSDVQKLLKSGKSPEEVAAIVDSLFG